MTQTITIFDNQANPKFGAKFNGSIEDTDTYETIGYLDFLTPSAFFKKLDDAEKAKLLDLVYAAENDDLPIYLSLVKSPLDKSCLPNSLAMLTVKEQGIFTVSAKLDGELGDEVWLQQRGSGKNRYVGFDNAERESKLGVRVAA